MVVASPTARAADRLVFWSDSDEKSATGSRTFDDNLEDEEEQPLKNEKGESMYVTLFEDMLCAVLNSEAYLLSCEELEYLRNYVNLTNKGRYLLVRLCLRKTDKWHRLDSLRYQAELGSDIISTIIELCGRPPPVLNGGQEDVKVKIDEKEVIDLTYDEGDSLPVPGPSTISAKSDAHRSERDYFVFAQDESHAELRELLECLTLDELKGISKEMKLKTTFSRDALIDALLSSSSNQTTLMFSSASSSSKRKGKERADRPLVQATLAFPVDSSKRRITQVDRLREIVMKRLGKCIRISDDVVGLFRRLNLIYFRSTQHAPSLLVPSILSRAKKRTYPSYKHERTANIWPSREALLAYEAALELEAQVDALLEGSGSSASFRARCTTSKTPVPPSKRPKTPVTPKIKQDLDPDDGMCKDGTLLFMENPRESTRMQSARAVKAILEQVYPRWRDMLKVKDEISERKPGLERFECGHILTRVVCKGATALGTLWEHKEELDILEALLTQRRWRRGRRGRWHERRALILTEHFGKSKEVYIRAKEAVIEGLLDDDTHMVFRPKLERRLTRLEKQLKIPEEEWHVCQGKLSKAKQVSLAGVRVYHRATSIILDQSYRVVNKRSAILVKDEKSGATLTQAQLTSIWTQRVTFSPDKPKSEMEETRSGKSIWKGRNDEEVSVEILALQHYETQGYKGFHCEGRIVTTIFGLLFWDVLFENIPGAFETPYQSAPLDIAEDTFYFSRQTIVDARLDELRAGQAQVILERVYDEHAQTQTWCVGVRWDLFGKEDLLAVVDRLGGTALAVICRMLCEDYAGRVAGVPDLVIWNIEECKFVEVKGPNDVLRENQKVWIDVLLQAGVPVEVCHVYEQGTDDPLSRRKGKGKGAGKSKSRSKDKKGTGSAKRKREDSDSERDARLIESEDEPQEVDYSQLDASDEEHILPITPQKRPMRQIVNRAEVVITSSPAGSPPTRRRTKDLASSP